jgi:hypothetical protein
MKGLDRILQGLDLFRRRVSMMVVRTIIECKASRVPMCSAAFACVHLLSDNPLGARGFADSLAAGQRRSTEGGKLTLSHDIRCFTIEAFDLVLRLAVDQLRQETDDFIDAGKTVMIKLIKEALNGVNTRSSLDAN